MDVKYVYAHITYISFRISYSFYYLACGSTNAASETLRVLPDQLLSANIADIESAKDFEYADIRERDHFANFITCVHLHTEWAAIFSQQPNPQKLVTPFGK